MFFQYLDAARGGLPTLAQRGFSNSRNRIRTGLDQLLTGLLTLRKSVGIKLPNLIRVVLCLGSGLCIAGGHAWLVLAEPNRGGQKRHTQGESKAESRSHLRVS